MTPKFDRNLIPLAPDFAFEIALWDQGYHLVAGIDEAGRGALAGPVAAGALIFPDDPGLLPVLEGVRDSKELTAGQRALWAKRLLGVCLAWGVGFASAEEIDTLGIVPATCLAACRAVQSLGVQPEHLLVDYLRLPELSIPQTPLVKGDARSLSIAAASILAKTRRDALLCELEAQYPGYGLAQHKGYATEAHRAALERLGPSPIHRLSFAPCKKESTIGEIFGL
jgi:ribonuclease HII